MAATNASDTAEIIGNWRIISRDATGKRATARCTACGSGRELSIEALESGAPIACPGCLPTSFYGPASRRSFATDLAKEAVWSARKRHRMGGAS
jgi:hypothetical protein